MARKNERVSLRTLITQRATVAGREVTAMEKAKRHRMRGAELDDMIAIEHETVTEELAEAQAIIERAK